MFNVDKCKVMYIAKNNSNACYFMGGKHWRKLMKKWAWGYHELRFKSFKTVQEVVNTANWVVNMIHRTFTCRSSDILMPLYKCLVKSHLEYVVQAWRLYLTKDIDLLENVDRRDVMMMVDMRGDVYEE